MQFSPYFVIIAIGCFAGALLMFTRLREHAAVTYPTGILLILGGIYLLCREFVSGFAESPVASWTARAVLVVFLIYLLLSWNNLKAERNAEFDFPADSAESGENSPSAEEEDAGRE